MIGPSFLSWDLCNPGTKKWSLKDGQETKPSPSELISQPCPAPPGHSGRAGSCAYLRPSQAPLQGLLQNLQCPFRLWVHQQAPGCCKAVDTPAWVDTKGSVWEAFCLLHFWGGQVFFNAFQRFSVDFSQFFSYPNHVHVCEINPRPPGLFNFL